MPMLNRTVAPEFKQVDNIHFVHPENKQLANGIPVFIINAGEQDLVRIEFIFQNINWDNNKPLSGIVASGLINSGSKNYSAKQIAEKVDYYGAFLQNEINSDYATLTLYTLTKHLSSVLPLVYELLNESIYPQSELEIYQQNHKQRLQVSLQKNDYLARKTFAHAVFGNTAYGVDIQLSDYDKLQQRDLLNYYQSAYQVQNCTVVVAGKFKTEDFEILNQTFGGEWKNAGKISENSFAFEKKQGEEIFIEKPEALQSAIRMGNLSINRNHPDFPAFQVLNCVLGGYFGSRLMANIRENKGYTYGIGSAVVSMQQAGYFFLATEVGVEVCTNTLVEIEKEINLLKSELISENELALVRNFMLGSMLGSLENAFSHADKFKNIYFLGLNYSYYDRYIHTVKTIDAQQLNQIANQYLSYEDMIKVVVGKK